jgi:hypothetical protein
MAAKISTVLRQWCKMCEKATLSKPCLCSGKRDGVCCAECPCEAE